MTRDRTRLRSSGPDPYAAHRCVNCRHLRYLGEVSGDPCRFCPCTDHVVPSEVTPTSPERGDAA